MRALGGPCRVEIEGGWPEVNDGLIYTDRVQGRSGQTLLGFYCTKHATSDTAEGWRQSILSGAHSINGQTCRDPDTPIP